MSIWNVEVSPQKPPKFSSTIKDDFKREVSINNNVVRILIDTGAKVSVCGIKQANSWGLINRIQPSHAKVHPYKSPPISVEGTALCSVTYKNRTIPVEFYILPGSCQPILDGDKAKELKIISIDKDETLFNPINMIDNERKNSGELTYKICDILQYYPENFQGLGKLRDHQVKLYTDNTVKPIAVPPRPIPYHLKTRVNDCIDTMIKEGVIEEHPPNVPAPWVSCAVIVPKPDNSLRITMDARNLNKSLISNNYPIPRQEDIRAQLSGANYFSKLDFKLN